MVTFKEFFSFKNNRFFWLNLIAMVVVIVAAAWGTFNGWTAIHATAKQW